MAWLHNFRRVVTRCERHVENDLGFVYLGRIRMPLHQPGLMDDHLVRQPHHEGKKGGDRSPETGQLPPDKRRTEPHEEPQCRKQTSRRLARRGVAGLRSLRHPEPLPLEDAVRVPLALDLDRTCVIDQVPLVLEPSGTARCVGTDVVDVVGAHADQDTRVEWSSGSADGPTLSGGSVALLANRANRCDFGESTQFLTFRGSISRVGRRSRCLSTREVDRAVAGKSFARH